MKSFHVGVKGVFVQDGKVLILKRETSNGSIFWDMPGGRINAEESLEETLHRELEEELGVTGVTIGDNITAYRLPDYHRDNHGLVTLFYSVRVPELVIHLSDEHIGYRFVNHHDLNEVIQTGEEVNEGIQKAVIQALE